MSVIQFLRRKRLLMTVNCYGGDLLGNTRTCTEDSKDSATTLIVIVISRQRAYTSETMSVISTKDHSSRRRRRWSYDCFVFEVDEDFLLFDGTATGPFMRIVSVCVGPEVSLYIIVSLAHKNNGASALCERRTSERRRQTASERRRWTSGWVRMFEIC